MTERFTPRGGWRAKLEKIQEPKIVNISPETTKGWRAKLGKGTMLIPRPLDVDAMIRRIPKGKLATVSTIREKPANDHNVDVTCPLTTGIFIRIAAEAADEDLRAGKKRITPYWRVLADDGRLRDKLPGGIRVQAERLEAEGFILEQPEGKKTAYSEEL